MTAWSFQTAFQQPAAHILFDELVTHLKSRSDLSDIEVADRERMILRFRKAGPADFPTMTLQAGNMFSSPDKANLPCAARLALIDRFIASVLPKAPAALDLKKLYPSVRQQDRILDLQSPLVRPLAGDLVTVVMQDQGDSLATITGAEMGAHTVGDLWQAAGDNLRQAVRAFDLNPEAPGYLTIRWPENPVLSASILLCSTVVARIVQAHGWQTAIIGAASRRCIRLANGHDSEARNLMQADLVQDLNGPQAQSAMLFMFSSDAPWLEPWRIWDGQEFANLSGRTRH